MTAYDSNNSVICELSVNADTNFTYALANFMTWPVQNKDKLSIFQFFYLKDSNTLKEIIVFYSFNHIP